MNLEERINAFAAAGDLLRGFIGKEGNEPGSAAFRETLIRARQKNQWFTPQSIIQSFSALANWLQKDVIAEWLGKYYADSGSNTEPKNIGVIMAGNIPMVGFHDMLCILISGNNMQAKLAGDDAVLLPFFCTLLIESEPRFASQIKFTDKLEKPEAVIATGGNNSARYFEYYFGRQPHIIRKNRNAVAIFTGNETLEDLLGLGEDIFSYFGLGCRNVSKLYVPTGYDFSVFFKAMESQATVMQHNKYMNNYDYHNTLYLLNSEKFLTNNFLILKEHRQIATPVSVIHYEYYDNANELELHLNEEAEKIQCIVGKGFIPFGKSQSPALSDYADGIDVMQFLIDLKKS